MSVKPITGLTLYLAQLSEGGLEITKSADLVRILSTDTLALSVLIVKLRLKLKLDDIGRN